MIEPACRTAVVDKAAVATVGHLDQLNPFGQISETSCWDYRIIRRHDDGGLRTGQCVTCQGVVREIVVGIFERRVPGDKQVRQRCHGA